MKTFDISLTDDFDRVLLLRERELCAALDAHERPGPAAAAASKQSLATVDEAQAEQTALELEQVLAARRRLHEHSYGSCGDCGESIALARLSAMPATATERLEGASG